MRRSRSVRSRVGPRAVLLGCLILAASTAIPAGAAAAGPPARVVSHGSRSAKVVALTFDDGWNHAADASILATLVAEKVTATFFPYALTVRGNEAFWRKVARLGFPIGNHTFSHPYLTGLPTSTIGWELAAAQRLIEKATGVPMLRVFRPPYGAYDARVLAAAAGQGYGTALMWDTSAGDTTAWPSYWSVLRGATAGWNGSIVLFHAGPMVTANTLRDIIRNYKARGYGFVTIPQLLGSTVAPWPTPTPTPSPAPSSTPTPWPTPTAAPTPTPSPTPTGSPA
jgi:peptidoglycan/xylan/chitin deacetylase (PgdA/CDA1 family)